MSNKIEVMKEKKRPLDTLRQAQRSQLEASKLSSFFNRCGQDTPPFFKKLRLAGLIIAAAGAALLAAPVALPAAVVTIGGYLVVGGSVASAMSQAAIEDTGDCTSTDDHSTGSGQDEELPPIAH